MNEQSIKLEKVSKNYKLFRKRGERVKELIHPLRKKYHKKYNVLDNIELEINKGEVLGIVGKNGSGKSTLLKLISGVILPDEGNIEINGRIAALLELGAGFNPEFTGLENLIFYNSISGVDDKDFDKNLKASIAFADIGEFINQPFKLYSSGMKSRLSFAAAIQVNPDILIIDEVLAVGDEMFKQKCFKKINEFLNIGKTILLVSHSIHTINQFCTRAILLDDNRIIDDGKPKDITQLYFQILYKKKSEEECKLNSIIKNSNNIPPINTNNYSEIYEMSPVSIVVNENVRIGEVYITDVDNLRVNILHIGKRYSVCFFLYGIFPVNIENVLIGCTLVNGQGVHVCGLELKVEKIREDQYLAKKSFDCCLNEDIYSIIVASRLRSHEVIFYTRTEDCTGFKVVNTDGDYRWGLINL